MADLPPRHECFCVEFVKDGNGTQAAVRAGFSEKSAHVTASRLLSDAKVKARIAKLREPIAKEAGLTLAAHLETLADLRDKAVERQQMSAAVSAEVSRGKAVGLYTEKREHTFPNGGGVLLVPTPPSPAEWAEQVAARQAALITRPPLSTAPAGE